MKAEDDNEERSFRQRYNSPEPSAVSMKSDKSMKTPIQLQNTNVPDQSLQQRYHSPDLSVLSLKSDKSMTTPIQMKDGHPSVYQSAQTRAGSFVPSVVSMKSDKSMKTPIQLQNGSVPDQSFRQRYNPPEPSAVSLKSDKSMKTPIQIKHGDPPGYQSVQTRSGSFVPSVVSMKSDKSMKTPIQLQNTNVSYQSVQQRYNSPYPSAVSLKSDKSMKTPIQLQNTSVPDQSLQQRHHSPDPSAVSLKSDKSMKTPTQLQNGQNPGDQRYSRTNSYQDILTAESLPGRFIPQQDSETLEVKIKKFKSNIKQKHQYLFEGFAKQRNPTLLNEIYIDLYITEGGNGEISNEHEYKRIEKSLKTAATATIPIKCRDIFTPLPGQDKAIRTVLTKGVAGIGKTVSVQKFILDWAEEKENQDVQLIFPLPFREINLMKDKTLSLSDLLQLFFPQTKEMEISSDKYRVMFILDGLDECRLPLNFRRNETLRDANKETSVDVLLTNLIVGNLLPSALIWITSRPAAADLVPSECVHRVTEVRGFNDPQKEEYFSKRISDQSLANTIISHLKSSRSLYIMCHIPVFCWISATVLEKMLSEAETAEIPKTLTQMYTHFLMAQINIKDRKYNEINKDKEMIFKLGKLAYEQLERGNIIFYEEDLRECGIDVAEASVYSGLCTQIFREEFGLYQEKVFSFVHLSIQEHLAALYVHLSFHNNGENVLEAQEFGKPMTMLSLHKSAVNKTLQSLNGRFDLFLRFLLGHSLQSNYSLIKDLLVKKEYIALEKEETIEHLKKILQSITCAERALLLHYCLKELNDQSFITETQSYLNSGKLNSGPIYPHIYSALVYILMASNEKFAEFELQKYGKGDLVLNMMHPVIKLSKKIWLKECNLTYKGCITASAVISSQSNVRELDLSHNNLDDRGAELISVGYKRSRYREELIKEWCSYSIYNLNDKGQAKIAEDYVSCTAGLQDTDCRLQSLNLRACGITEAGCDYLGKALSLNPSHLKVLDLSWNTIGDSGVKHLCAALEKDHSAMETLKLEKCGLTEESCAALASAFSSKSSSLTDLDLSINDLQDSGVQELCVGLQNPHCKLQKLRLSDCKVTHEGVAQLTKVLESNSSHLKELDLENNLTDLYTLYFV